MRIRRPTSAFALRGMKREIDVMKQKIISFDVGVKNMSYCLVESTNKKIKILGMKTLTLKGKNIQDYTNSLIMQLRKLELGYIDTVLIEQQLNRNTQMKVLSHVLQTYFACERNIQFDDICFYNPKLKFETSSLDYNEIVRSTKRNLNIGEKMSRSEIKKLSIAITKNLLLSEEEWLKFIENNIKKDDLSDAYLQAYTYSLDKNDTLMIDDFSDIEMDDDL